MAAKTAKGKGTRYTDEQKKEILDYAASQGRGGQSKASKKFKVSPLTISNWKKAAGVGGTSVKKKPGGVDKDAVLRDLAGKGFKIERLVDFLTNKVVKETTDPKIEKLNLSFDGLPAKPNDSTTYVVSNGKQTLVTLTLDRLLALTGTKP